jgi:hypothetical protein
MKIAVIVVGSHYSGKSRTLKKFVKPQLGIGEKELVFRRNGLSGVILVQTFEEADRDIQAAMIRYGHHDLLILAARPEHETPSCYLELKAALEKADYLVRTVHIIKTKTTTDAYYREQADEVLRQLDSVSAKAATQV